MIGLLLLGLGSVGLVQGLGQVEQQALYEGHHHTPLSKLTTAYFDAFKTGMQGGQPTGAFCDESSTMVFQSAVASGGTYEGCDGFALHLARAKASFNLDDYNVNILLEDAAKGVAVVESTCKGHFVRSGKPYHGSLKHVVTWNVATNKVISHIYKADNQAALMDAYMVRAEKLGKELLTDFYESESPITLDSPFVEKHIADDFVLELPKTVVHTKTTWTKTDLFAPDTPDDEQQAEEATMAQQQYAKRFGQTPAPKEACEASEEGCDEEEGDEEEGDVGPAINMSRFKRSILFADNDKVLVQVDVDSFVTAAGTEIENLIVWQLFEFNAEGKLRKETVTFSRDLQPWELLPRPALAHPTPTDDDEEAEEELLMEGQATQFGGRRLLRRPARVAGRAAGRAAGRTVARHAAYGAPRVVAPVPYAGYNDPTIVVVR